MIVNDEQIYTPENLNVTGLGYTAERMRGDALGDMTLEVFLYAVEGAGLEGERPVLYHEMVCVAVARDTDYTVSAGLQVDSDTTMGDIHRRIVRGMTMDLPSGVISGQLVEDLGRVQSEWTEMGQTLLHHIDFAPVAADRDTCGPALPHAIVSEMDMMRVMSGR